MKLTSITVYLYTDNLTYFKAMYGDYFKRDACYSKFIESALIDTTSDSYLWATKQVFKSCSTHVSIKLSVKARSRLHELQTDLNSDRNFIINILFRDFLLMMQYVEYPPKLHLLESIQ
jgi:hypothetical protein